MIQINGAVINLSQLPQTITSNENMNILAKMHTQNDVYRYNTMEELEFEVKLRVQIVKAANLLNESGAKFANFANSKCNEEYWELTDKGAFILKEDVLPSTGIEDIFKNGRLYAFECATAIVIVFYKAILQSIHRTRFNQLFSNLYLYDWEYHDNLDLYVHKGEDALPGDCVYFQNPQYDPEQPQWKGENAIVIDDDRYFGHGIGIRTGEEIIYFLNTKRKEGATKSAFLVLESVRINTENLRPFRNLQRVTPHTMSIKAHVGSTLYII
ncbi:protein-glutamine gamma-glutamyltransferase [Bacillus sp. CGMCC 1.16541]|uniref:protein-glutamine gamma-glutamyltransferase n=1 Tax=Bacillus sp. CGMCC 1.16541 TaxID=2185143 RepID=UPI001EF6E7E0|nr:protein-glutamine gamma-glutamyltransferase [Bacillus sp. CGMCC 1.16541]